MLEKVRKIFLAAVVAFIVLTTGAWQNGPMVPAESRNASVPETPLYPGFTWSSLGLSSRNIRINLSGDSRSLSGEGYQALEQYIPSLHQDVLEYYSNEQLAKSGWVSYDSLDGPDGIQHMYYHESGVFLSVGFLKCLDVPSNTCVTVWKSEQTDRATITTENTPRANETATLSTFGKRNPSNGQTSLNPTNTTLSWQAYVPTPDKYSYCIKAGSACPNNDPEWTSVYDTSINLTNLAYNTTYHWQVRAVVCETCTPKVFVYADGGTAWTFTTRTPTSVVIRGNAGVATAVLSYVDGTARTVTADATGAYSITVPYNWSGTITPSKSGYLFSPRSASFTNLTAAQTIQNFTAGIARTISGNAGAPGVTLSYIDVTPQTVVSDGSGNYIITVLSGWSGIVTPSRTGVNFTPPSRSYTNLTSNQTAQDYAASVTISGNVGLTGVPLSYVDGTSKTVLSDGSGNFSISVPFGWTGMIIPYKTGVLFSPLSKSYSNIQSNQSAQNFTSQVCMACADISAIIAGTPSGAYTLNASQSLYDSYGNLDNGPAKVMSTNGVPLVASTGIYLKRLPDYLSYTELMGLPASKLTDTYIFPWYNNATAGGLSSQLRFGNVGNAETDVTVTVGGVNYGPYHLGLNGSDRVILGDIDAGPVQVKSSGGVPIIASMRVNLKSMTGYSSYSEFMGVSASATVGTKYMFPRYNNATAGSFNSQLRFGNMGNAETDVTVKVGGVAYGPYHLVLNGSQRVTLDNVDAGPVEVSSSGGVPIIASMRVNLETNPTYSSYSEFMGTPGVTLTETRYLFPWYNNATAGGLQSQLRFANIGGASTTVTIKIGGVNQATTYNLAPNASARVTLDNVDAGPVEVFSSGGVPIIASMRINLKTNAIYSSYSEFMGLSVGAPLGLPGNNLSTTYWFPWYNNANAGGLASQLRFAVP